MSSHFTALTHAGQDEQVACGTQYALRTHAVRAFDHHDGSADVSDYISVLFSFVCTLSPMLLRICLKADNDRPKSHGLQPEFKVNSNLQARCKTWCLPMKSWRPELPTLLSQSLQPSRRFAIAGDFLNALLCNACKLDSHSSSMLAALLSHGYQPGKRGSACTVQRR